MSKPQAQGKLCVYPRLSSRDQSESGIDGRYLGVDNKEGNGEFCRSRTARSLESSKSRMTCRGDQRVRMIYHSRSMSLTAADPAEANFVRNRSAKSRINP